MLIPAFCCKTEILENSGIYFFGGRRGDILITYNRNNQIRKQYSPPISWAKTCQFITNMCIGPVLLSLEILSLPDVDQSATQPFLVSSRNAPPHKSVALRDDTKTAVQQTRCRLTKVISHKKGTYMRYIENIISPPGSELRNISSGVEKYFKHEKRNFVSPSDHVMFQKYQTFHTKRFCSEWRDILCSLSNMIFLHCVKIANKFSFCVYP